MLETTLLASPRRQGTNTAPTPEAARSARERFLAFAFAAADLLVEVAEDGTILYATGSFSTRFGALPEAFHGRPFASLVTVEDRTPLALLLSSVALRGRLAPVQIRLADAARTPMSLSGLALPGASPRICLTLSPLPAPMPSDPSLTPAGALVAAIGTQRQGAAGGVIGLVEVEGWKGVREALDPEARRAVQARIREAMTEIAGPDALTRELGEGRYGIVAARAFDAAALGGEIEAQLRRTRGIPATRVGSSAIALDAGDDLTDAQAVRALRYALQRFSEDGMAGLAGLGFAEGLEGFVVHTSGRARAMRAAIRDGRLRLAFQPVARLATRSVQHYEALLRPVATPGNPVNTTQEFVMFAEAVGLSEELDLAVLARAAEVARGVTERSVAVNVSGLSMQSPAFRERALALLGSAKKAGARMLIELTETAEIDNAAEAARSVQLLREAGHPVCIDDFGAGAAAFRYLREFRVDYVKIEGSYVRNALASTQDHGFIASMVALANFVGAKTIAEMVETEQQAALMRDLGVEFGQGWLYGRPGALPGSR